MTKREMFQKAFELFEDGKKWADHCPFDDQECIVTAIYHTAPDVWDRVELHHILYELIGRDESLGRWNDTHTFPDVRQLFERAIEVAE